MLEDTHQLSWQRLFAQASSRQQTFFINKITLNTVSLFRNRYIRFLAIQWVCLSRRWVYFAHERALGLLVIILELCVYIYLEHGFEFSLNQLKTKKKRTFPLSFALALSLPKFFFRVYIFDFFCGVRDRYEWDKHWHTLIYGPIFHKEWHSLKSFSLALHIVRPHFSIRFASTFRSIFFCFAGICLELCHSLPFCLSW